MLANTAHYESSPGRFFPALERYGPTVACVAAGLFSGFTISLGGQMPAGELVLLVAFPWAIARAAFLRGWPARIQQLGWFKLMLILAGMTALGYIASDLYRVTPYEHFSRGWARVGFLIIDLIAVAHLIDRSWSRLYAFVLSLYIGSTLNAVVNGPLYDEWWQFGIGYTTTILTLFACAGRHLAVQLLAPVLLGGTSIFLGARSLGALCIVTAGLYALPYARGIWRPIAMVASLAMMITLLWIANTFVIAEQDHAGSNVERQSMLETATELFIESPLIGQGSWFTATSGLERLERNRTSLDKSFRGYTEEEARQLSIHSQLLVALAEGGLLGGAFFFGLGVLLLKTLRNLTRSSVPRRAFLIFLVLNGLWNLLMSPFSGVVRVEIALVVATCLLVILQRQGELAEEFHE